MNNMKVLSLFDGISCGYLALQRAGIPIETYYASEIDKTCIKVSQKHFPNIIQLGDVNNWRTWDIPWKDIDLVMGGHGMTDLLRNAIDDLLDTISSRETYRSAEHRVYAQMNKLTEAGAMISLAIELLTSNIRHSYGEINFERHPRPVEVEGEDKH